VGNTIGAGILRTPGDIAGWFPASSMFVGIWLVGALYTLLGANAVAELGTMMPKSGGQYVFARYTFGDYAGFLVGWIDWISTCASIAAIALVLGESFSALIGRGTSLATPIAMASVAVFTVLLLGGTKLGDRTQQITSLAKALALLALVAACFAYGSRAGVIAPVSATPVAVSAFTAFILSAQSVIYAYDGWTGPIYFSEELNDPARQIPRAMFGSVACVALIYVLINVAFMRVVPPARARRLTTRRGDGGERDFWAGRRDGRSRHRRHRDVERDQRTVADGVARVVRGEPRWARIRGGQPRERGRHANGGTGGGRGGGPDVPGDGNVQHGHRHRGVLLRGELQPVVHRRVRAAPSRTRPSPAVSRVGPSMDYGTRAGGVALFFSPPPCAAIPATVCTRSPSSW
jgi:hypothetical protein